MSVIFSQPRKTKTRPIYGFHGDQETRLDCYDDRRMCDAANKLYTLAVDTMFCSLWLSTPINYSLTSTAVSLSRRLYRLLNGRTTSLALLMPLSKLSTKLSVTVDNAIRSNSLSFAYKSENGLNDNEDQPSQMHRPGLQFS